MQGWRDARLNGRGGFDGDTFTLEPHAARALLVRLFAHQSEAERRLDARIALAEDDEKLGLLLRKVQTLRDAAPLLAAIATIEGPMESPRRGPDLDCLSEINEGVRSALEAHHVADDAVSAAVESVVQWFADETGQWEPLGVPRPSP